jgi:hypothetical protein
MMNLTMGRAFLECAVLALATASLASACAGKSEPKVDNGVDDVHAACQIRTTWVHNETNQCSICAAAVVSPRCDCSALTAFSGACDDQATAAHAACPTTVDDCVSSCKSDDCNCVEACYASDASCKQAAAARDGCQAEACTQYCK